MHRGAQAPRSARARACGDYDGVEKACVWLSPVSRVFFGWRHLSVFGDDSFMIAHHGIMVLCWAHRNGKLSH